MPAEWEPHASTWLGWPHNRTDWPGKFPPIPWVYAEIVRHLARVERVDIIVEDAAAEAKAREVLERASALRETVRFHRWRTNRGWTRDFAPLSSSSAMNWTRSRLAPVNFRFNGWAKYPDWPLDQRASEQMVRYLKLPAWTTGIARSQRPRLKPEARNRSRCSRRRQHRRQWPRAAAHHRRMPAQRSAAAQSRASRATTWSASSPIIWESKKFSGWSAASPATTPTATSTTSRASFRPTRLSPLSSATASDANHEPLANNLQRLRGATDQRGRRLNIVELPMPAPVIFRGRRLPASYANFYIANRLRAGARVQRPPTTGWRSTSWPTCFPTARSCRSTVAT